MRTVATEVRGRQTWAYDGSFFFSRAAGGEEGYGKLS